MTLEEIRTHKEKAEQDIRRRLQEFAELTGMCPIAVSAEAYSHNDFMSGRLRFTVGNVSIRLEDI